MERVELAEREEHGKGVRRPRSDAARRPRPQPQAALVAGAPAADGHPGSHGSYDSYREPPRSEHPGAGRDRSAERRPAERYADVRKVFSLLNLVEK